MGTMLPRARRVLAAVGYGFMQWRHRGRTRDELRNLDDRTLHDIGISRCDVSREAAEPFWMP